MVVSTVFFYSDPYGHYWRFWVTRQADFSQKECPCLVMQLSGSVPQKSI